LDIFFAFHDYASFRKAASAGTLDAGLTPRWAKNRRNCLQIHKKKGKGNASGKTNKAQHSTCHR
jgi:hypothetical protein